MVDIGEDDELTHDWSTLLSSDERDFLIRNNGDQVKISTLIGKKTIGIYVCSEPGWIEKFTPLLVQVYHEIGSDDFEVVLLMRSLEDRDLFDASFAKMPWLAVPHWDLKATWDRVSKVIYGYWNIFIVAKTGETIPIPAALIEYYGAEAYPFTRERIRVLNEEDAVAKRDQSLASLLGDHLVCCATGQQISVSELVGKTVGLYQQPHDPNEPFTDTLIEIYNEIKDKGGDFEVVVLPNRSGEAEAEEFKKTPWLALPYNGKQTMKLWHYFPISMMPLDAGYPPYLYIIGTDGKTLSLNGSTLVRELGSDAFPFTPQKLDQLERAKLDEPWSLEKLLVFRGRDFLIRKDGSQVPVAELAGKTIMFYFSDGYNDFPSTDQVIESCSKIKEKHGNEFEVILIGFGHGESDLDRAMLALPNDDVRNGRVANYWFEVKLIPTAILVDPCCQIVTREAVEIIGVHGSDAYPFTEEHLEWLDHCAQERSREWPHKLRVDEVHEHELDCVVCEEFLCDGCYFNRNRFNYKCNHCGGFDLHHNFSFANGNDDLGRPDGRHIMELMYLEIRKELSCL